MITRRRFLTISAAAGALGAAAAGPAASGARIAWRGRALGAETRITLRGPEPLAERTIRAVTQELRRIEALCSLYDPASALSRLNAAGELADPDPDFLALLRLCGRLHAATGGAFDPTIQPLWRAHAQGGDVAAARARVGWDRVRLSAKRVRLGAGQALTLNGIAQGWAGDRVAALLRAAGFTETLVDMGEPVGIGGPWRVGVAGADGGIVGRVTLRDRALAVSCPDALRIGAAAHVLHPDPARAPRWRVVAVEAESAAVADGLSTSCCLLPRAQAEAACRELPGAPVLRVLRV